MQRNGVDRGVSKQRVAEVAALQREWFGRPLGELFAQVCDIGGLTQAQLGERLGISAPMVSQLMTGRREKPGNPPVQDRIIALSHAMDDFDGGRIDGQGIRDMLDSLRSEAPMSSRSSVVPRSAVGNDPMAYTQFLRNLLSAVASAGEIDGAAKLLSKKYPELAELLRVHGTGRASEALAHLQRLGFA